MLVYFIFTLIILILLACVGVHGFRGDGWGVAFLMWLLHGLAGLLLFLLLQIWSVSNFCVGLTMSYVFTLRIKSYSTAMAQVLAFHYIPSFFILSGYASVIINAALEPTEGIQQPDYAFIFFCLILSFYKGLLLQPKSCRKCFVLFLQISIWDTLL